MDVLTRSALGFVVLAALLFVPAGTLAWPQAWIFLLLFLSGGGAIGLWLRRADPDLLAERMKSPLSADQLPRDRAIMAAILACFAAWLASMGFDARFGWSHVPRSVQGVGAGLIVAAFWGWVRVLAVNSYASATIRVQAERGQMVISRGPYAVVRHPMYAFALIFLVGVALLLGSFWGLVGLLALLPLLAARVLGEEAVLENGLPGYRAYAAKVRFRLLPWVW